MPFLLDDTPVVITGFVVEYFLFESVATIFEDFHDGGVVTNAVGFILGLERCLEGFIRFTVVGDHNVLIAAARANGEATSVVCV